MKRIALIGAMDMEVAPFLKELEQPTEAPIGPIRTVEGFIGGVPVTVMRCGISKVNAAMATQAILQRGSIGLVIHTGVGGALVSDLKLGDVVIADHCVQYDVDTSALGDPVGFVSTVNRIEFSCDAEAVRRMNEENAGGRAVIGCVATGDRFITARDEKNQIWENFHALLCDQESAAVAQVCGVHGIPCAIIRAVSDATDEHHGEEYTSCAPSAARRAAQWAMKFVRDWGENYIK